jgi:hypothetical protein
MPCPAQRPLSRLHLLGFEQNLTQLKANQARAGELGAVRHGTALLSGLLRCGRCGNRLSVRYAGRQQQHSYLCSRLMSDYGGKLCQSIAGPTVDAFVSQQVLAALEPAALTLSLEAARGLETERAELDHWWQQRLERADFEAERAARHYRLLEPENRLVARQLALEWEEKLTAQQQLQADYQRFLTKQPKLLSAQEREAIARLAQDLPALWNVDSTTIAERKEIVRQLIEDMTIDIQGESERVDVTITWVGGECNQHILIRPVGKLTQLSYYPQLCQRVRDLAAQGWDVQSIAQQLNEEGYRPPKRHETFGRSGVQELLRRLGLTQQRSRSQDRTGLAEHEWWLPELAQALDMPATTLSSWIGRGWVKARKQQASLGRWIVWADEAELERLRQRHARPQVLAELVSQAC